jgi:hypothetical protein
MPVYPPTIATPTSFRGHFDLYNTIGVT